MTCQKFLVIDLILYTPLMMKYISSVRLQLRTAFCQCVYARDCEWKNLVEPERSFFTAVYTRWICQGKMCAWYLIKISKNKCLNQFYLNCIYTWKYSHHSLIFFTHFIPSKLELCQSIFVDSSKNSIIFMAFLMWNFFLSPLATTSHYFWGIFVNYVTLF